MRTEQEIDAVLSVVRKAWKMHPELRLGQLLHEATEMGDSFFYLEDQKLADGCCELYESRRGKNIAEALSCCESRCLDNLEDKLEVASVILNVRL